MASRKDQKEQLRREREEREAAARAQARRRQLIGYVAGAAIVLVAIVVAVAVLAGGGDDEGGGSGETAADVLPDGGAVPDPITDDLEDAAQTAGCEIEEFRGKSREHTADLAEQIRYDSNPPTTGKHFEVQAEDGAYEEAPDVKQLVHTLEHGRVVVWFKKSLPADARADLKAFFDEDTYQMVLTPNETDMPYEVAASAWNRDPTPNGTGQLLACEKFGPEVFDALRAFRDEHRGNGPEAIP